MSENKVEYIRFITHPKQPIKIEFNKTEDNCGVK